MQIRAANSTCPDLKKQLSSSGHRLWNIAYFERSAANSNGSFHRALRQPSFWQFVSCPPGAMSPQDFM
jgi:hypothetical protein